MEDNLEVTLKKLSLFNKINDNRTNIMSILELFIKIKKEYYADNIFIEHIDEIIKYIKYILNIKYSYLNYSLIEIIFIKYKIIKLYEEYKEIRFLNNKLNVFIEPLNNLIDIYENYYKNKIIANINNNDSFNVKILDRLKENFETFAVDRDIKDERLKRIKQEVELIQETEEKLEREKKQKKEILYHIKNIEEHYTDKIIIELEIKKIIDNFKISQTEISLLLRDTKILSDNVWEILNKIYEESYADKYTKNGGMKKPKKKTIKKIIRLL